MLCLSSEGYVSEMEKDDYVEDIWNKEAWYLNEKINSLILIWRNIYFTNATLKDIYNQISKMIHVIVLEILGVVLW